MATKRKLRDTDTERVSFYDLKIGDLVDVGFGFVRSTEVRVSDDYAIVEYKDSAGVTQEASFHPSNWRSRIISGQWPEVKPTINPSRPIEPLAGDNRGIVRQRLANTHCMTRVLEQARIARPKGMRFVPVALRRGWALCVLEAVSEYRGTFVGVMSANLDYKANVGAFD